MMDTLSAADLHELISFEGLRASQGAGGVETASAGGGNKFHSDPPPADPVFSCFPTPGDSWVKRRFVDGPLHEWKTVVLSDGVTSVADNEIHGQEFGPMWAEHSREK